MADKEEKQKEALPRAPLTVPRLRAQGHHFQPTSSFPGPAALSLSVAIGSQPQKD